MCGLFQDRAIWFFSLGNLIDTKLTRIGVSSVIGKPSKSVPERRGSTWKVSFIFVTPRHSKTQSCHTTATLPLSPLPCHNIHCAIFSLTPDFVLYCPVRCLFFKKFHTKMLYSLKYVKMGHIRVVLEGNWMMESNQMMEPIDKMPEAGRQEDALWRPCGHSWKKWFCLREPLFWILQPKWSENLIFEKF